MATQPLLMSVPFANAGAKNTIPQNTTTLGKASLVNGFPTETSMPIDDGGVPPQRADFNGMLYWLSTFAMFQQSGGKFTYNTELFYDPPSIIFYNNDLWWCKQKNGPNSEYGGVHIPGNIADNEAYWIRLRDYLSNPLAAYPIGSYFINSVDTNPSRPISEGGLGGGTWEQVQDRMILAAGIKYSAGNLINPRIGGSNTIIIPTNALPNHTHSITINKNGLHTHSVTGSTQYAGNHTHQVQGETNSAGSHSHTRGNMNITGSVVASASDDEMFTYADNFTDSGALKMTNRRTDKGGGGTPTTGAGYNGISFDASREGAWTGSTSVVSAHTHDIAKSKVTALTSGNHFHTVDITVASNGEHSHTGSANSAGEGKPFDFMPPYIVAYVWRRIA